MMVTARMSSPGGQAAGAETLKKRAKRMAETAADVSGCAVMEVRKGDSDPNADFAHSRDLCAVHKFGQGALSDRHLVPALTTSITPPHTSSPPPLALLDAISQIADAIAKVEQAASSCHLARRAMAA